MPKVIGIIGCRSRDTEADGKRLMTVFLRVYEPGDSIVSGGCPRGGDRFATLIARTMGIPLIEHYPNWGTYGRSAGFKRNGLIARDADILLAVVSSDRKGGTEDTIRKAQALGKPVVLID